MEITVGKVNSNFQRTNLQSLKPNGKNQVSTINRVGSIEPTK